MGEEAKQEQAKEETKAAEEEKKQEKEVEVEAKKEEPKLPAAPFILYIDLHCVGCAKKIEKSIMRIRGVEGVVIDMSTNQVTIKGVVEPQAVCTKIMKKTKRKAKVLSPLPPAEGQPIPQFVNSQVSGLTTVDLNVNMHCEACADQLKRKILQMRGVRTATTELSSGKVTVTGTMDGNKLVDYVYRRTKKQAKIVPQPEPEEPKPEEKKEEDPKPAEEEPKPEENKEEPAAPPPPPEEEKKEGGENIINNKDEQNSKVVEEELEKGGVGIINNNNTEEHNYYHENINIMRAEQEQSMQRMMMMMQQQQQHQYYQQQQQPLYVIERIPPPPQIFSDENPNACRIS